MIFSGLFPSVLIVVSNKEPLVSDCYVGEGNGMSWAVSFVTTLLQFEKVQYGELSIL